jgi:hypothetical protein
MESSDSRVDGRVVAEMVADFMASTEPWLYSVVRYL